ncbi:MAG: LLM class flavin-dependent oxidoreductase [Acidithiobacillus sp.]|nr:LLM class flavin-dependent oxidoreductase [Acidithiobacillus sp.]
MEFSTFDLLHWPYRGERCEGWRQVDVYQAHLEEWIYAEQLGFDAVWLTEHHFTDYNLMPSPNVMLAALSQRTSRVKIGCMINAVNFHNPWRLAEEAAMLDVLSRGRLLVGVGRSADVQEYEKFRQPLEEGRPRFREGLELMLKAWTQDNVVFEGEYFQIGPATIRPRPLQKPHPPVYLTVLSPESHAYAAEMGFPIASIFLPIEQTAQSYRLYVEECHKRGRSVRPEDYLLCRHVYVADTREAAISEAQEPLLEFFRLFQDAAVPPTEEQLYGFPENFKFYTEFFKPFFGRPMSMEELMEYGLVIVGDPDGVVAEIHRQKAAIGMEHLMCCMSYGNLPHEKVMHSMQLFGEHVMPQFR